MFCSSSIVSVIYCGRFTGKLYDDRPNDDKDIDDDDDGDAADDDDCGCSFSALRCQSQSRDVRLGRCRAQRHVPFPGSSDAED